jgi:hypothetical protein
MRNLLLAGATALLVSGLFMPQARANPFRVTIAEDGSSVVANGNGALDIKGLSLYSSGGIGASMTPVFSDITLGTSGAVTYAVTFLADQGLGFGPGGNSDATGGSGDAVGLFILTNDQGQFTNPLTGLLTVPENYVSNSPLSDSATWDDSTFASLGLTPGVYSLVWGNTPNQSFTVVVQAPGVPDPSSLALFVAGLLGLVLQASRKSGAH